MSGTSLIITSIANDQNPVLRKYASECRERGVGYILIGDTKSPKSFNIEGCDFYGIERQKELGFQITKLLPEKHYSRKNIGYLIAMKYGSDVILETDDDNFPLDNFWAPHGKIQNSKVVTSEGWVNVYECFSDKLIWPRGYPLEKIRAREPLEFSDDLLPVNAPIQQGLADENPDVDAVYRLTYPLPFRFDQRDSIALGRNSWCPFNSQNTLWFKEAFPLLYLPSFCSFRMTDIWRSFVGQRIAWEYGWHVLFRAPSVWQDRNDHSLLKDFLDEIPGYLNNEMICEKLMSLKLSNRLDCIYDNLIICYESFISEGLIEPAELALLDAWCSDIRVLLR